MHVRLPAYGCMCMHVHMSVDLGACGSHAWSVDVYVHACPLSLHAHVHKRSCVYACECVSLHACMHACMYVCAHVRACVNEWHGHFGGACVMWMCACKLGPQSNLHNDFA
jgi:hypothetical protein